jgi:hypothetical protein
MNRRSMVKLIGIPLLLSIGSLMVIGAGFSPVGFAQGINDVRTDSNWIYRNMELLAREGLLKDYPMDWVQAGHSLERSEIAYYLKQMVLQFEGKQRDLKLSPWVIEVFQALILEFQKELGDLGIKATDINNISPNPISLNYKPDNYQDLDLILESRNHDDTPQSYYYYGHYYSEWQRKSFFFIPSDFIATYDANQLEVNHGVVNILYQPQLSSSFLVLKGSLPGENHSIKGYYLFPITGIQEALNLQANTMNSGQNRFILSLLDEVNQLQQVDSLLRYSGSLNLEGFLKLNVDLLDQNKAAGNLDQGLTIGGLLIYSNNSLLKTSQTKDFGLPVFNSRQTSLITPVDLDLINSKSLQSLQINIQGTVEIAPQTSLFGGIDLFYQKSTIHLDNLWPSDAKASAGVTFHMNDYWTFLTYQSLVNSQSNEGWFSTTSVGVEYGNWITLWLAYQFLKFDNPTLTGTLSFRF